MFHTEGEKNIPLTQAREQFLVGVSNKWVGEAARPLKISAGGGAEAVSFSPACSGSFRASVSARPPVSFIFRTGKAAPGAEPHLCSVHRELDLVVPHHQKQAAQGPRLVGA